MNQLVVKFKTLSWRVALAVFCVYFAGDWLYAAYTLAVTQKAAGVAALLGSAIHLFLAYGVVNYTRNYLYLIPLVCGSWAGTYWAVKLSPYF